MTPKMEWEFSATQWIFGNEDIDTTARRLASLGYAAIELAGEPAEYCVDTVAATLDRQGLRLSSICGIYSSDRDISHPDAKTRGAGIRYICDCATLAASLGASIVIVVPTAVGRVAPLATRDEEWQWAVESVRAAADSAASGNVRLVIEALNRYETYLVNTLAVATELVRDVDRSNVGIMADFFHMNIEEADIPDAIRTAGGLIWHVHLADSNRRPPGLGHTDFRSGLRALEAVGYDAPLTMEFLPSTSNPYDATSHAAPEAHKVADVTQAIEEIRRIA